MNKLRIGLAGFGYWGPNLARAVNSQDAAILSGIAEVDESKLAKAKSIYPECAGFKSVSEMILSGKVDAVIIATPAETHDDVAREAIENNLHALIEKPMSIDPNKAMSILEIAKNKNLVYMPGHTFIYNDAILWAKDYIKSGQLGEVLNVYSQRLNLGQLRKDVNVVWNLAPHDISIFDFLLDSRVVSVSATGAAITQPGIEDIAFISLQYKSGVIGHSHVSWLDPSKTRKITIIGMKGMLVIDDTSADSKVQVHEKFAYKSEDSAPTFGEYSFGLRSGDVKIPNIKVREPLFVEIEDFVRAVSSGEAPKSTAEDGIWVAKVLNAIDESIAQGGTPVELT
jgi:predicted dehydrogenase